ncbi:hypothetical protein C0J52_26778 [Blattella germanica]|nr:hypothetical protein C0J52_26778 [Blattella germanica]
MSMFWDPAAMYKDKEMNVAEVRLSQCWMHRYNKSSTPQKLLECYQSTNKDETPYTVSEIWLKAHCNYNSKITITYSDLGDSQNKMESSTETSQYSESDDSIFGELDQPTTPDTAEASSTSEDPSNCIFVLTTDGTKRIRSLGMRLLESTMSSPICPIFSDNSAAMDLSSSLANHERSIILNVRTVHLVFNKQSRDHEDMLDYEIRKLSR